MVKPVTVSAPSAQLAARKQFLTHGDQDFLETWLALGLRRKCVRWSRRRRVPADGEAVRDSWGHVPSSRQPA